MALHKASRQPQLTWDGWKVIGLALNMGEVRADYHARGVVTSRGPYGQAMARFLNATGFAFLNKGVRWALRECINNLADVDEWRDSLEPNDRTHLNNPIDVWERFKEDQRNPRSYSKRDQVTRQRRGLPSMLDQVVALQDMLDGAEQKVDELEATLIEILGATTPEAVERLSDELLRRVFAKLPPALQDTLHERLYPTPAG
jgi:hypothetical protein